MVLLPLGRTCSLGGAERVKLTESIGESSGEELGLRMTVTLDTVIPTVSHLRVVYFFVSLTSLLGEPGRLTRADRGHRPGLKGLGGREMPKTGAYASVTSSVSQGGVSVSPFRKRRSSTKQLSAHAPDCVLEKLQLSLAPAPQLA